MRGTTLSQLRYMLRAELGQTLQVAAATQGDAELNTLLYRTQHLLASEHSWPFLEHRWDVSLVAGTRFYSFPTTASAVADRGAVISLDTGRPFGMEVWYNQNWMPVLYSITGQEFVDQNSDGSALDGVNAARLDPVQRWRYATNVSEAAAADQFEVWPIPESAGKLRISGQRQPLALYSAFAAGAYTWNNDAKADLDDELLVLWAAATKLGPEKGVATQARANRRLLQCKTLVPCRDEPIVLGANLTGKVNRSEKVIIKI